MRFCPEAGATTISTAETPVAEVARVVVSGIVSVADGGRLATSVVVVAV